MNTSNYNRSSIQTVEVARATRGKYLLTTSCVVDITFSSPDRRANPIRISVDTNIGWQSELTVSGSLVESRYHDDVEDAEAYHDRIAREYGLTQEGQ